MRIRMRMEMLQLQALEKNEEGSKFKGKSVNFLERFDAVF